MAGGGWQVAGGRWQVAGVGLGIPDGGDGGGRQADGVCVAGGEPQAGAQRVTGRSKPGIK